MFRVAAAVVAVLTLAACSDPRKAMLEQGLARCNQSFPPSDATPVTPRFTCYSIAFRGSYPDNPTIDTYAFGIVAIAEKIDRGEITRAEGNYQRSKLQLDLRQQAAQTQAAEISATMLLIGR